MTRGIDDKTEIFYIKLGNVKWAFRASVKQYSNDMQRELGVVKAKDTDNDIVFQANRPTPVRVRFNLANGKQLLRWCDPQKVEGVTVRGTLNGKKYQGQNINSVTVVTG